MNNLVENPLLNYAGLPPFAQIKNEHIKVALDASFTVTPLNHLSQSN